MDTDKMFFEDRSRYPLAETVERFTEEAAKAGWRIIHTHDLQQTMSKNGFLVKPIEVLELCNPRFAHKLLSDDGLKIYASMMPCRIAVYEKEDGCVYLSRMNNGAFAGLIGGTVEEVMTEAYRQVETFVAAVAE